MPGLTGSQEAAEGQVWVSVQSRHLRVAQESPAEQLLSSTQSGLVATGRNQCGRSLKSRINLCRVLRETCADSGREGDRLRHLRTSSYELLRLSWTASTQQRAPLSWMLKVLFALRLAEKAAEQRA